MDKIIIKYVREKWTFFKTEDNRYLNVTKGYAIIGKIYLTKVATEKNKRENYLKEIIRTLKWKSQNKKES